MTFTLAVAIATTAFALGAIWALARAGHQRDETGGDEP